MAKQRVLSLQHNSTFRQVDAGRAQRANWRNAKQSPMKLSEQLRRERELLFGDSEHRKAVNEVYELCGFSPTKMAKELRVSIHMVKSVTQPQGTYSPGTLIRIGELAINYLVKLQRRTGNDN